MFLGLTGIKASAQSKENKYPILYIESFLGRYPGETRGLLWGGEINYQVHKNLLSLRYSKVNDIDVTYILIFPVPNTNAYADEIAILYGRRIVDQGRSLSISMGLH